MIYYYIESFRYVAWLLYVLIVIGYRKLFEKASSAQNLAITRFRWIRVALFEKKLQSIVCYIVQEADR